MRELVTVDVVLKATGLSRSALERSIRRGDFPQGARIGKRALRWPKDEVEAWIEQKIMEAKEGRGGAA